MFVILFNNIHIDNYTYYVYTYYVDNKGKEQENMQVNTQDVGLVILIERLIRKVVIMMEIHKWSRTARRAINNRDTTMAEIAIKKFDELNKMI